MAKKSLNKNMISRPTFFIILLETKKLTEKFSLILLQERARFARRVLNLEVLFLTSLYTQCIINKT